MIAVLKPVAAVGLLMAMVVGLLAVIPLSPVISAILPTSGEIEQDNQTTASDTAPQTFKGKKVAIVDDDLGMARWVSKVLTKTASGIEVQIFEICSELLAVVPVQKFDFYLLDYVPKNYTVGVSGSECALSIRDLHPDARMMVYSSMLNDDSRETIREWANVDAIAKEVGAEEIVRIILSYLH